MPKRARQFAPTHTRTRQLRILAVVVVLVAVFAIPMVRSGLRHGVSAIGLGVARSANSVGGFFGGIATAVRSKETLATENAALRSQVDELTTRLIDGTELSRENADLRAAMGRSGVDHFTLAAVISKPPHSVYDTLVIDGGTAVGFSSGETVYANGVTPIGTIEETLPKSAIVRLYSAPGQETEGRLSPSDIDVTLVGRGGGNFSATVPHDVSIADGANVVTKEVDPSVVAVYKKITSDSRDPFQTLLLASPTNINQLSYVEVRQN